MEKVKIGITTGDLNSISLEVILKALNQEAIFNNIIPILYSNVKIASYHKNIVNLDNINFYILNPGDKPKAGRINLINCWQDSVTVNLGKPTPEGGKYAILSLQKALEDAQKGEIDAIVTGPISKHAMKLAGFEYQGHTDFFIDKTNAAQGLMMMVSDKLIVGLVTDHIPLSQVEKNISKEKVLQKIRGFEQSLQKDFGIEKPHIAVLGLNPHAGEEGQLGNEEEEKIRPAIIEAKKNGIFVAGPYPADGFFGSGQFAKFDGILAMYHDQGLIPFKTIAFDSGVNYTSGLPFVRTSPDHGTAFELAGKNVADPSSMVHAIYEAKNIVAQRKGWIEMRQNVLKKRPKLSEEMSE